MYKDKFKMNLQLFNNAGTEETQPTDEEIEGTEEEIKTFTQEDIDKIVKDRLAREKANHEKEVREKIAKEREDAKRLADLSADEREKAILEQKESDIAERESKLQMKELELDTINRLVEEELPISFKEFVIKDNAETTNENIKSFKNEWKKAIEVAVNERLKGETPRKSSGGTTGEINPWDKDTFNLTQQGKILREDPVLAARLQSTAR